MAIPFGCECGKRLQAKDEFAGKKMRCPGCGKTLTIPGLTAAPPVDPAIAPGAGPARIVADPSEENGQRPGTTPPAPELAVAVVHFVCSCGRPLKARKSDAGEQTDCPDCGRTLFIPATDTESPPPVTLARRSPNEDGLLSQTITPWPNAEMRRRGSDGEAPDDERTGSGLRTLVVLLLLAGGLGVWWYFKPDIMARARAQQPEMTEEQAVGSRDYDPLTRIPSETLALYSVRSGALGMTPLVAQGAFAQYVGLPSAAEITARIGPLEDWIVAFLDPDPRLDRTASKTGIETDTWVFVRTVAPYDRKSLIEKLWPGASYQRRGYHAKPYYAVSPAQSLRTRQLQHRMPAIYFASPTVFVVADTVSIKHLLRQKRGAKSGALEEAIGAAASTRGLVVGLNQNRAWLVAPTPDTGGNVPPPNALPALKPFTTALVVVNALGPKQPRGVTTDIRLAFMTAADATKARKALEAWRADQQHQRTEQRQKITASQAERRLLASLLTVGRGLGSMTAGQLAPLGPLHVATKPVQLPAPDEESANLARLKAEEVFQQGLTLTSVNANTLLLRSHVPMQLADWARQMSAPYVALALNSRPQPRIIIQPPLPKGKRIKMPGPP